MPMSRTDPALRDVAPAGILPRSFAWSFWPWVAGIVLCTGLLVGAAQALADIGKTLNARDELVQKNFGSIVGTPATSMQNWNLNQEDGRDQPAWSGVTSDVAWVKLDQPTFVDAIDGEYNGWGMWALSEKNHAVSMRLSAQAATEAVSPATSGSGHSSRSYIAAGEGYHPTRMDVESTSPRVSLSLGSDRSVVVSAPATPNDQTKLWAWVQNAQQKDGTWVAVVRVGSASNADVKAAMAALASLNESRQTHNTILSGLHALVCLLAGCAFKALKALSMVRRRWSRN